MCYLSRALRTFHTVVDGMFTQSELQGKSNFCKMDFGTRAKMIRLETVKNDSVLSHMLIHSGLQTRDTK